MIENTVASQSMSPILTAKQLIFFSQTVSLAIDDFRENLTKVRLKKSGTVTGSLPVQKDLNRQRGCPVTMN